MSIRGVLDLVGDGVLLLISRLRSRAFRGSDRRYRYGGEEFIAIVGQGIFEKLASGETELF